MGATEIAISRTILRRGPEAGARVLGRHRYAIVPSRAPRASPTGPRWWKSLRTPLRAQQVAYRAEVFHLPATAAFIEASGGETLVIRPRRDPGRDHVGPAAARAQGRSTWR
jgi:hypothetical protein